MTITQVLSECKRCKGVGEIYETSESIDKAGREYIHSNKKTCGECGGNGVFVHPAPPKKKMKKGEEKKCPTCNGTQKIKIPSLSQSQLFECPDCWKSRRRRSQ